MSVQAERFTPHLNEDWRGMMGVTACMRSAANGEYVRFEEYEAQAERTAELEAELARHRADRPFVIGWNDGFEFGVNEAAGVCRPTDFNDSDEVRVWKYVKHRILALIVDDEQTPPSAAQAVAS